MSETESSKRKPPITDSDLEGLGNLKVMRQLLERLHGVGAEGDKSGNRKLHMDDYCLLVLLWLYNPIVDSLRGLQQASELESVRKRLGVGRASMGSLSESVRVFDPAQLAELAEEMSQKLPHRTPENFDVIDKKVTAVDRSVFRILTQIASLAWVPTGKGKSSCGYRLHAQFEVFRGTTSRIDVTTAKPKGEADERRVLERTVESGRCYLLDRGYQKHTLWNAINEAGSDYVCRVKDSVVCTVTSDLPLTEEEVSANIVSDQLIEFGTPNSRTKPPDHAARLIIVKVQPHDARRAKNAQHGPSCDGYLRLVTNNLDAPAEIIAALYEQRWTIELYFRIIKQLFGCRHLLSTKTEGVTIQFYMAIIACIMILSITGKRPTKRTFEMICFYLSGWASLDELEKHVEKLKAN